MKDSTCPRCRAPKHVWLKLSCSCTERCDHPACYPLTGKSEIERWENESPAKEPKDTK